MPGTELQNYAVGFPDSTLRSDISAPRMLSPHRSQFYSSVPGPFLAVIDDDLDEVHPERGCAQPSLTKRELQVLRHLAVGNSTDEIGRQLLISRATVRNHISRCLRKLEVHSRVEAVGIARRLDLV